MKAFQKKMISRKIKITLLIVIFVISVEIIVVQFIANLEKNRVGQTYSMIESKDLDVFVNEFKIEYPKHIDDSLTKYKLNFKISNLKIWIEKGFVYKNILYSAIVVTTNNYRLNYFNPSVKEFDKKPQFYLGKAGQSYKDVSLYQKFESIYFDQVLDTIKCDTYLFFSPDKEKHIYLGEVLLIANKQN